MSPSLLFCVLVGAVTADVVSNSSDLSASHTQYSFKTEHPAPNFRDYPSEPGVYFPLGAPDSGQFPEPILDYNAPKIAIGGNEDVNYPVKTVQRFTDGDGNIQVVTSYSNRDDSSAPIYKAKTKINSKNYNPVVEEVPKYTAAISKPFVTPVKAHAPTQVDTTRHFPLPAKSYPRTQEYSATKTVRFPDNSGEYVSEQHQKTSSDGRASSYNTKTSYNRNSQPNAHKRPVKTDANNISPTVMKSVVQTPLEVAGSSLGEYATDDVEGYDTYEGGYGQGGGGHGGGHGGGYEKEKGNSFEHAHQSAKGGKGSKGHKSEESYNKGHSESHGHEENKGGTKHESGEKTGHLDEANTYTKGHESDHGQQKTDAHHSKGHKKGHKTKGFRTVHHKDEYKKDEVFYDEEHDIGGEKKRGQEAHEHGHTKGGSKKKGHLDSGYKEGVKGFSGDKEEGHSYESSKGHSGKHGTRQHHGHQSEYGKASGHKEGESHGHGGKGYY